MNIFNLFIFFVLMNFGVQVSETHAQNSDFGQFFDSISQDSSNLESDNLENSNVVTPSQSTSEDITTPVTTSVSPESPTNSEIGRLQERLDLIRKSHSEGRSDRTKRYSELMRQHRMELESKNQ